MEIKPEQITTKEGRRECLELAREAALGKYRNNRQPHIACMIDPDPRVRWGAIMMSQVLLDEKIVDEHSQLLALETAVQWEKSPLVRALFESAIDAIRRHQQGGEDVR